MAQRPKDNLAPLRLHVPEPKFRPGDKADFSDIIVPPVDALPRPDEAARPADIHAFAYGLVRVWMMMAWQREAGIPASTPTSFD